MVSTGSKREIMMKAAVAALIASLLFLRTPYGNMAVMEPPIEDASLPYEYEKRIRNAYYDSSLVAIGMCRADAASEGSGRNIFVLTKVFAGKARTGERVAVNCAAADGEYRLFYLEKSIGSVNGSINYDIIDECCFAVDGEKTKVWDTNIEISEIKGIVSEQSKELKAPKAFVYYNGFEALMNACDAVVVGKVQRVSGYEEVICRTDDGGEIIMRDLRVAKLTVLVEEALMSGLEPGRTLEVKLLDEEDEMVIGSHDLQPVHGAERPEVTEGERCILLLIENEDDKEKAYFEVNPYQGIVELDGERVVFPRSDAFFAIENLGELRQKLQALDKYYYETE